MFAIESKVALVTGGVSGIGFCCAKELLRNGLRGITLADIDVKQGENAVKEIEEEFGVGKVMFVKTDITDKFQFEEAFKITVATFGNIDILINNAGIYNDFLWEKEVAVNINGTINGILLAIHDYLPKYRNGSEAVVVNIASITALKAPGALPIYTATKHAVVALSRCFGIEAHYNRTKIKVLAVCPGFTDTHLVRASYQKQSTLSPEYAKLKTAYADIILQPPEYVGKAVIHVIREGESGSVWFAEDMQPSYKIDMPN